MFRVRAKKQTYSYMSNFLTIQPASCRAPLKPLCGGRDEFLVCDIVLPKWYKENEWKESDKRYIETTRRVLAFDPTALYERIAPYCDPYRRHQGLSVDRMFPKVETYCSCGCGEKAQAGTNPPIVKKGIEVSPASTWQRKWASDICHSVAGHVVSIINNYFQKPAQFIDLYAGHVCCVCQTTEGLELDHVVGVKHGGGGSWLSNYRWLCVACHRAKTNASFGFGKKAALKKRQTKLTFI